MTANHDALRDLALRLLHPHPADPSADLPRLFVDQLPPRLPVDLPLPDKSRVRGSLVDGRGAITIVLDSDLPPEEVYAFYYEQLPAAGWTELAVEHRPHGGFSAPRLAHGEARAEVVYCHGAAGPAVSIRAGAVPGRPTDVNLFVHTDAEHTPCAAPWTAEGTIQLLPDLLGPVNGQLRPQGGGFGENEASSRATLETEDDLDTVAANYARQLEQAGWTRHAGEQDGPLAWSWSSWTRDEAGRAPRQGVLSLSILRQPEIRWQHGRHTAAQRPEVVQQYALEVRVAWHAPSGSSS